MLIKTAHLGEVEYEEKNVITFSDGLPGFENYSQFIIVLSNDKALPFHFLQSVENEDIAFVITDPFLFINNYDFEISEDVVKKLQITSPGDLSIYSITTIPSKIENTSINLAAPVIVNNTNNKAKQVILSEYTDVKHFIFEKNNKGVV